MRGRVRQQSGRHGAADEIQPESLHELAVPLRRRPRRHPRSPPLPLLKLSASLVLTLPRGMRTSGWPGLIAQGVGFRTELGRPEPEIQQMRRGQGQRDSCKSACLK